MIISDSTNTGFKNQISDKSTDPKKPAKKKSETTEAPKNKDLLVTDKPKKVVSSIVFAKNSETKINSTNSNFINSEDFGINSDRQIKSETNFNFNYSQKGIDKGLDNNSDEYEFSGYPKDSEKFMLGQIKGKIEAFEDIYGLKKGTIRLMYGDSSGDKKFNFDGLSIGIEGEFTEAGIRFNNNPNIIIPTNEFNHLFAVNDPNFVDNNSKLTLVTSIEGLKIGIKYENGRVGIGKLEFTEGAISTSIKDFAKEKPFVAIPIYLAVVGGAVTGAHLLNKGKKPISMGLGNITVYKMENEKHKLKLKVAPQIALTGDKNFAKSFGLPGAEGTVLYKYDNNLTVNVTGGYNPIDKGNVSAGISMKF